MLCTARVLAAADTSLRPHREEKSHHRAAGPYTSAGKLVRSSKPEMVADVGMARLGNHATTILLLLSCVSASGGAAAKGSLSSAAKGPSGKQPLCSGSEEGSHAVLIPALKLRGGMPKREGLERQVTKLMSSSFVFFVTLVTGPRRSLSLKLSDTRVYEPQIRATQPLCVVPPRDRRSFSRLARFLLTLSFLDTRSDLSSRDHPAALVILGPSWRQPTGKS